jgi:two-component system response regulator HydG
LRAIVLDETLEVGRRAHPVLARMGIQVTLTGSLAELPVAFATSGLRDVLIVNLGGELGSWEVAEHLRRTQFDGRTLVFADNLADPDITYVMRRPRTECIVRPRTVDALDALLERVAREMLGTQAQPRVPVPPRSTEFHGIVGRSRAMWDIFGRIEKVATGDSNVCIVGESGTGKELIARAIHQISARRDRPFITLDCTAIPEGLAETHLFGHVRGAFTGAVEHREGVFALAHTGTLFLDELCELSPPMQAKLLRVIQTRDFFKVGGTKTVRTNIRLIAATNKDPLRMVEMGAFREDLYYRVAVVMIEVPPLRERRDDIPLLVEHFLRKFALSDRAAIRGVTPALMDRLMAMPWPGNVRQLQNSLEQALVLAEGDSLDEGTLPLEAGMAARLDPARPLEVELGLPLSEVERQYVLRTLQSVRGNRTKAAKLLGISLRCLQYRLRDYLLERDGRMLPVSGARDHSGGTSAWMLRRVRT